jgi:hypothetical protein
MISDEDRRLAEETFDLIERSTGQMDLPAVTPEPADVSLALAGHTAPALEVIGGQAGTSMLVITLSQADARNMAYVLNLTAYEAVVGYDPIDDAVKVKIDGGPWSPPFGSS